MLITIVIKNRLPGKQANEIGPLAVFRQHVEAADERLLVAGRHAPNSNIRVRLGFEFEFDLRVRVQVRVWS